MKNILLLIMVEIPYIFCNTRKKIKNFAILKLKKNRIKYGTSYDILSTLRPVASIRLEKYEKWG